MILKENYLDKLKKRIPKNIVIEKVSDKEIHLANEYLESRKELEFSFSPLKSHFGNNWNYEEYPLGYFMRNTDNNAIVGFLGTICSKRQINNNEVVCCNLVHWYVEKEFRLFAYAFFVPLFEKKIIVYATTPRTSIIGLYKKLGFEVKTMKYTAGLSINILSLFSKNYGRFLISTNNQEIEDNLNIRDKQIYQDHKKLNCIHFVVLDKEKKLEPCYFIAKKNKRYRLSVLDLIYVSNIEKYIKFSPEIFTKISLFFKIIFIGQTYFKEEDRLKYNPLFLTRTVDKLLPIKSFNNYYIFDILYSDKVLFD